LISRSAKGGDELTCEDGRGCDGLVPVPGWAVASHPDSAIRIANAAISNEESVGKFLFID
jgi:hypothetical protein